VAAAQLRYEGREGHPHAEQAYRAVDDPGRAVVRLEGLQRGCSALPSERCGRVEGDPPVRPRRGGGTSSAAHADDVQLQDSRSDDVAKGRDAARLVRGARQAKNVAANLVGLLVSDDCPSGVTSLVLAKVPVPKDERDPRVSLRSFAKVMEEKAATVARTTIRDGLRRTGTSTMYTVAKAQPWLCSVANHAV